MKVVHPRRDSVRDIVCGVLSEAVDSAGASGVLVLDDWTVEGELVYEWLVYTFGEDRVWRAASMASNVQDADPAVLTAHPASKTTLLLGGALPRADVFPLGDLYASQVAALAGSWTVPPWLESVVGRAGDIARVDAALAQLVEGRQAAASAFSGLDAEAAAELLRMYERGRWYRLNPRLVPRLSRRTIGVDLFD